MPRHVLRFDIHPNIHFALNRFPLFNF